MLDANEVALNRYLDECDEAERDVIAVERQIAEWMDMKLGDLEDHISDLGWKRIMSVLEDEAIDALEANDDPDDYDDDYNPVL